MLFPIVALATLAFSQSAQETNPPKPPASEAQGLPPRLAPTDYQAHAAAGNFTIAAEFAGHSIPTPEGPLTSEQYVAVETAFFGAAGAKLPLSLNDFSLRINGKKTPAPSVSFAAVGESVKDPDWAPPPKAEKSKTSFGSGGGGEPDSNPAPVKVPFPVQRALALRVKKASLAEGDRPLPQAGLLFFPFGGKATSIHSVELIYSGPAGKTTIELQP